MLAAVQELFAREAAVYRKQGFANDDMFADEEEAEPQQGAAPASGTQQQQRQPAQAGTCSLMLSPAHLGSACFRPACTSQAWMPADLE